MKLEETLLAKFMQYGEKQLLEDIQSLIHQANSILQIKDIQFSQDGFLNIDFTFDVPKLLTLPSSQIIDIFYQLVQSSSSQLQLHGLNFKKLQSLLTQSDILEYLIQPTVSKISEQEKLNIITQNFDGLPLDLQEIFIIYIAINSYSQLHDFIEKNIQNFPLAQKLSRVLNYQQKTLSENLSENQVDPHFSRKLQKKLLKYFEIDHFAKYSLLNQFFTLMYQNLYFTSKELEKGYINLFNIEKRLEFNLADEKLSLEDTLILKLILYHGNVNNLLEKLNKLFYENLKKLFDLDINNTWDYGLVLDKISVLLLFYYLLAQKLSIIFHTNTYIEKFNQILMDFQGIKLIPNLPIKISANIEHISNMIKEQNVSFIVDYILKNQNDFNLLDTQKDNQFFKFFIEIIKNDFKLSQLIEEFYKQTGKELFAEEKHLLDTFKQDINFLQQLKTIFQKISNIKPQSLQKIEGSFNSIFFKYIETKEEHYLNLANLILDIIYILNEKKINIGAAVEKYNSLYDYLGNPKNKGGLYNILLILGEKIFTYTKDIIKNPFRYSSYPSSSLLKKFLKNYENISQNPEINQYLNQIDIDISMLILPENIIEWEDVTNKASKGLKSIQFFDFDKYKNKIENEEPLKLNNFNKSFHYRDNTIFRDPYSTFGIMCISGKVMLVLFSEKTDKYFVIEPVKGKDILNINIKERTYRREDIQLTLEIYGKEAIEIIKIKYIFNEDIIEISDFKIKYMNSKANLTGYYHGYPMVKDGDKFIIFKNLGDISLKDSELNLKSHNDKEIYGILTTSDNEEIPFYKEKEDIYIGLTRIGNFKIKKLCDEIEFKYGKFYHGCVKLKEIDTGKKLITYVYLKYGRYIVFYPEELLQKLSPLIDISGINFFYFDRNYDYSGNSSINIETKKHGIYIETYCERNTNNYNIFFPEEVINHIISSNIGKKSSGIKIRIEDYYKHEERIIAFDLVIGWRYYKFPFRWDEKEKKYKTIKKIEDEKIETFEKIEKNEHGKPLYGWIKNSEDKSLYFYWDPNKKEYKLLKFNQEISYIKDIQKRDENGKPLLGIVRLSNGGESIFWEENGKYRFFPIFNESNDIREIYVKIVDLYSHIPLTGKIAITINNTGKEQNYFFIRYNNKYYLISEEHYYLLPTKSDFKISSLEVLKYDESFSFIGGKIGFYTKNRWYYYYFPFWVQNDTMYILIGKKLTYNIVKASDIQFYNKDNQLYLKANLEIKNKLTRKIENIEIDIPLTKENLLKYNLIKIKLS